ncbi:fasciclin domain-containing protein, partial [Crocinitomicaceae bacterium]|nr:fasciclin domain-containing protein [Crocinitomicaceae bacterium]
VDGFSISDLMASNTLPESFQSAYALNSYHSNVIDPNSTSDINLNGADSYTVFLPNDAAVDAIRDEFGDPEISQFDLLGFLDLPATLRYNIVEGVYMAEDLQDGQLLMTTYGQNLTVSEVNGAFMVDDATIISTNYTADNGVVHIINKTLAPSGLPAMSVWDVIEDSEDHQFLEDAVTVAGFKTLLRKQSEIVGNSESPKGPFTVFAPTDAAFQAFAQSAGMATNDLLYSSIIDDLVAKHIVESSNLSVDISNNETFLNYDGEYLLMTVNNDGIFVDGIQITVTDVLAYNGVVHVIDAVLPVDIPSPEGTCGTWTLYMFDDAGDGWYESQLYVEVDGEIISVETGPAGNYSTFEFGVDDGDIVNLYYLGYGSVSYEESYVVTDANNQEIAASGQSGLPVNSVGLLACPEIPSCGYLEIVMSNEYGDGWEYNTLDVYRNGSFYLSIPFYYGEEQTTQVPVNNGEVLDFVYIGGQSSEPAFEGYTIYGPDGSVLVNQEISGQIPESTLDIVVCESQSGIESLLANQVKVFPNPATNYIKIEADSFWLGSDILLTDVQGKEIKTWKEWNGMELDLSNIPSGLYLIELNSTDQKTQKRLVIE